MAKHIYRRFLLESELILQTINSCRSAKKKYHSDKIDSLVKYSVVNLYERWSGYCRDLILYSASGRGISLSGQRISKAKGFVSYKKSERDIKRTFRGYFSWANSGCAIFAAKFLKISNYNNISLAIGSNINPSGDIRIIRNFFAHSNGDCAVKLKKHSKIYVNGPLSVDNLLFTVDALGVPVYEQWICHFQTIAESAAL